MAAAPPLTATLSPHPIYTHFPHRPAKDLLTDEVLTSIFPVGTYDDKATISAFFVRSSAGRATLVLGNGIQLVELSHGCDPFREVVPVRVDCRFRRCSTELCQAVNDYGKSIKGTPKIVAIQIDYTEKSPEHLDDPQSELVKLIKKEVETCTIGSYDLNIIPDSWADLKDHDLDGIAFEQDDRIIRTWVTATNPHALQKAKEAVQREIDQAKTDKSKTQTERDRRVAAHGEQAGATLDKQLAQLDEKILEHTHHLRALTAETVNSAAGPTLKCTITMQIDDPDRKGLLERYVRQEIVNLLDDSLREVTWAELKIGYPTMRAFVQRKFNVLKDKVAILTPLESTDLLADWGDFQESALPKKQAQFEQDCPAPPGGNQQKLLQAFQWVTTQLRRADNDLIRLEMHEFVDQDISLFTEHRTRIQQVLRTSSEVGYQRADQLQVKNTELSTIAQCDIVHMVKRVSQSGKILLSIRRPPDGPGENPDSNSNLNEVHIPICSPPTPF